MLVKIGGLLSLASDGILGSRLFGGNRLFESSSSELGAGERVLIGSGINILTDLVTERV